MNCRCGTPTKDLPVYFLCRVLSTVGADGRMAEDFEEHMFSLCTACDITYCSCGNQHTERPEVYR